MQSLLRHAGRARRTIDDVGEDNEKWGFVAHYTYSYDLLLLLLLLLVMMTMVHSQSGTVFAGAVCTTGIGWCGAKQFFGQHTHTQCNFFFYLLFLLPLGPRSAVAVVAATRIMLMAI